MVYRWRCPQCPFVVWAPDGDAVVDELTSHLREHYEQQATETVFRTEWTCPSCSDRLTASTPEGIGTAIEQHLIDHEKPRIVSGTRMTSVAIGAQSVLTLAPDNGTRNFARTNLASECDTAVFVTTTPRDRLTLVDRFLTDELDRVVLVVPRSAVDSEITAIESDDHAYDLDIRLPDRGLDNVGTTVSNVLHEPFGDADRTMVDFELFEWLIDTCPGDSAFRFTHVFIGVVEATDAIAHFSIDPSRFPDPTIRTYAPLFDLTIAARSDRFVSVVSEPNKTVQRATAASSVTGTDQVHT